jgi:hypothetical protein
MGAAAYEYRMVGWLAVFSTLMFLSLAMLGIGQINANEIEYEGSPNLFEGVQYFYTNPYTSFWAKAILSIIVFTPLIGIGAMATVNLLRGRG